MELILTFLATTAIGFLFGMILYKQRFNDYMQRSKKREKWAAEGINQLILENQQLRAELDSIKGEKRKRFDDEFGTTEKEVRTLRLSIRSTFDQ